MKTIKLYVLCLFLCALNAGVAAFDSNWPVFWGWLAASCGWFTAWANETFKR